MKLKTRFLTAILCTLILLTAGQALAQDADTVPERSSPEELEILDRLESVNPDAVAVFKQATRDMDNEYYAQARAGYEIVLTLAPDFPDALRRLASCEIALGLTEEAIDHANRAYTIAPTGYNATVLAQALMSAPGAEEVASTILRLAKQGTAEDPDGPAANHVLMFAAALSEDKLQLRIAAQKLIEIVPDYALPHYIIGSLEAELENWEKAEAELLKAKELGFSPDEIDRILETSGISAQAAQARAIRWVYSIFVGWIGTMGILFLIGLLLSRLTLVAAKPTGEAINLEPRTGEKWVRSIYRFVISLTSLYFYISIPFLVLIIVGIGVGLGYLFLETGRIPLRLAIFIGLAIVYTLYAIVRSIFTRIREEAPGRPLTREEAPALWALTEAVAQKMDTRPIESIYITPGTEIAVMEMGGIWRKLSGKGRRSLILGLGVLPGLQLGAFRAILAHEYGHFRGKDTAGGSLARLVQHSLWQIAMNLAATRQARWYNPVWLFINGFQRLFLVITHGASRLQEILADRFAALAYGPQNMIAGLKHVIRASMVFNIKVNKEVELSLEQQRNLVNVYTLPELAAEAEQQKVEDLFSQALESETDQYDTHPSPADRFRMVETLQSNYSAAPDDERPVSELLPNPLDLQLEMTGVIQQNVEARVKFMQQQAQAMPQA